MAVSLCMLGCGGVLPSLPGWGRFSRVRGGFEVPDWERLGVGREADDLAIAVGGAPAHAQRRSLGPKSRLGRMCHMPCVAPLHGIVVREPDVELQVTQIHGAVDSIKRPIICCDSRDSVRYSTDSEHMKERSWNTHLL